MTIADLDTRRSLPPSSLPPSLVAPAWRQGGTLTPPAARPLPPPSPSLAAARGRGRAKPGRRRRRRGCFVLPRGGVAAGPLPRAGACFSRRGAGWRRSARSWRRRDGRRSGGARPGAWWRGLRSGLPDLAATGCGRRGPRAAGGAGCAPRPATVERWRWVWLAGERGAGRHLAG